jgi:hypothetical protein
MAQHFCNFRTATGSQKSRWGKQRGKQIDGSARSPCAIDTKAIRAPIGHAPMVITTGTD